MARILLCDKDTMGKVCETHTGWPIHGEDECALLAGIRPFDSLWICTNCDRLLDRIGQHFGCCGTMREYVRGGDDYIDIVRINGSYGEAALWAEYFAARRLASAEPINA